MQFFNFEKSVKFCRRRGVSGFVQTAVMNFTDLILLNLMFVLFSLPVITLSPALCALNEITDRMARDEPVYACRDYVAAFKRWVRRDFISAPLYLIAVAIGVFAFACYFSWAHTYAPLYGAAVASLCAVTVLSLAAVAYFPLLVKGWGRANAAKGAVRIALTRLDRTGPALLAAALPTAVCAALLPYSLPLVLLFPFSLSTLAACYAMRGVHSADIKCKKI